MARNGAGLWSAVGVSDPILAVTTVSKISDAKAMTVGSGFVLPEENVTATSTGQVFIEEPDRSSGLKVNYEYAAPDSGYRAIVAGTYLGIVDNEPTASAVEIDDGSAGVPSPLGINNKSVGWPGRADFQALTTGVCLSRCGEMSLTQARMCS